ncbi:MAG: SGNH/GDSL hydrolase family protein [Planctomycetota bacterium]|jgi:lysophospholipase L1-like esterase
MSRCAGGEMASVSFLPVIAVALVVSCATRSGTGDGHRAAPPDLAATPSFADFDRRAREGERLNVVFFGASLTWGANATDQGLTSYRALVADRLRERYPHAHFRFYDGAIGGTGSQTGVFRLERDCLRREPDLVSLDFSANDDIYRDAPETLASYESLVRRIVTEGGCPVVVMVFPFKWNVEQGNTDGMKGRDAHLEVARAYGAPVGDAISDIIGLVKSGKVTTDAVWPHDGVHPGDLGYTLFADSAMKAFAEGVERGAVCRAPEKMLHADTYMRHARVRISSLGALPEGWKVGTPNLVSAWYDALMSRWLDDEVIATGPGAAPLRTRFNGTMLFLFGEKTMKSGTYRVRIDGEVVAHEEKKRTLTVFDASSKMFGGNTHLTQVIATGLEAGEHALEIEPLLADGEELRLESICVAGGKASVRAGE